MASKLAVLRNELLYEASSSTLRGALWARLRSTSSCVEKEAVAVFEGLRDFFRVGVRWRPEKSLTGIHGSLGRCALRCTQMAKVELRGGARRCANERNLGGRRRRQGVSLGSPALDASGTQLLSRKVENDEADIMRLIDEALSLAEGIVWAVDQPGVARRSC